MGFSNSYTLRYIGPVILDVSGLGRLEPGKIVDVNRTMYGVLMSHNVEKPVPYFEDITVIAPGELDAALKKSIDEVNGDIPKKNLPKPKRLKKVKKP